MLTLLISDSTSHFFDDANVLPTDTVMLRRSTDDLSNVSDTDGNVPDKVIIDADMEVQECIDVLMGFKKDTEVLLRVWGTNQWKTRDKIIDILNECVELYNRKQMEECK